MDQSQCRMLLTWCHTFYRENFASIRSLDERIWAVRVAPIAKIHSLLDLQDPTSASSVKLRLQAIRRRLGTVQKQAGPLRFKEPVCNVERDAPRGLNVRALLESSAEGRDPRRGL